MSDFKRYSKFIKLTKVDEAKREVGGIVTAQVEDKEGEICDYATTVPYYKLWSEEMSKATDGKNLGNLREMHGLSAAGVGKSIEFDDDAKEIRMTFKVVDDQAWTKVQEGVYTGFSQGGSYIKVWEVDDKMYYTAAPAEVSLVDNPCLGIAHFDFVRADGRIEVRKFKVKEEPVINLPEPKSVPAEDTQTLKFLTADDVRQIIQDFQKKEKDDKVAADAKVTAEAKKREFCAQQAITILTAKAAEIGLVVEPAVVDEKKVINLKAGTASMKKGMYEVSWLAAILSDLCYLTINQQYEEMWEDGDSSLPDELKANLESLAASFLAMCQEETEELIESATMVGKTEGGVEMQTGKVDLTKAGKSLADQIATITKTLTENHEKVLGLVDKFNKSMAEVIGGNYDGEVKPIDPESGAAPNLQHALTADAIKALVNEEVNKAKETIRDEAQNEIIDTLVKALSPEEEAAAPVAAKPGVGDRTKVVIKTGPVVRVVPVVKDDDDKPSGGTPVPVAEESINMNKVRNGDRAEILRFMKGTKPTEVPNTLTHVVARAGSGR